MGRISSGPTRWPPGAERRLVPAESNLKNLKPVTLLMLLAQSQISRCGDRKPPRILNHDAEREVLPRRSATTRVARYSEFGMMGPEAGRMDGDGTGDTVMGGGEERRAPEGPPRDSRD